MGSRWVACAISSMNDELTNACGMLSTDRYHPSRVRASASPTSICTLGIAYGISINPMPTSQSARCLALASNVESSDGIVERCTQAVTDPSVESPASRCWNAGGR